MSVEIHVARPVRAKDNGDMRPAVDSYRLPRKLRACLHPACGEAAVKHKLHPAVEGELRPSRAGEAGVRGKHAAGEVPFRVVRVCAFIHVEPKGYGPSPGPEAIPRNVHGGFGLLLLAEMQRPSEPSVRTAHAPCLLQAKAVLGYLGLRPCVKRRVELQVLRFDAAKCDSKAENRKRSCSLAHRQATFSGT